MNAPRILGAVLAGGQSSRFGSDKALALFDGETLLAHAVARLGPWCERVVIVGRNQGPAECLPDWPAPGMGPLGAIAAALRLACAEGHDAVLTCGVDSLGLPADLPARLAPAPAYVAAQPVVALWPVSAAHDVAQILEGEGKHSVRALAERIGARAVDLPMALANINTPADLARAQGAID